MDSEAKFLGLYAMRVTSGVPLLRCFARRLETEHEQFSLPQKILMISALTDLNYRVTKEMENILRSPQFSFGKLYPFQISRLLCSFGRMNQTYPPLDSSFNFAFS